MTNGVSFFYACRFDQCSISPLSLKGVKDAGYEKMTVVQEATLPVILKGSLLSNSLFSNVSCNFRDQNLLCYCQFLRAEEMFIDLITGYC